MLSISVLCNPCILSLLCYLLRVVGELTTISTADSAVNSVIVKGQQKGSKRAAKGQPLHYL